MLFIALFLFGACQQKQVMVGLLVSDANRQTAELTALYEYIESGQNMRCEYIEVNDSSRLYGYDIVWYHKNDSTGVLKSETKLKSLIVDYVSSGGKLILSMDAVDLLNDWDIEPEQIAEKNYQAVNEGFGRKVDFHAYREHPLFDKMFGGAYTWHGKNDNTCRVKGFFGDKFPKAAGSRVIGTLWEYIFYHPEDKILWETSLGNGKILSIGGFLYYSEENFHKQILKQFTQNCLDYMSGKQMESKTMYWENRKVDIVQGDLITGKIHASAPTPWGLSSDTVNTLSWKAGESTIDLPSQRSILIAQESGGIEEIWTHPILALRDYRVWLDIEGQDTLVSLNTCQPTIELRPNSIIRNYRNDMLSLELKEILVSQVDAPVTVTHYEWTGEKICRIIIDCKSNLRFMWPYDEHTLGSIYYNWSPESNMLMVYDGNKEFVSFVGSNVPGKLLLSGRYDGILYNGKQPVGKDTDKLQIAASMAYDVQGVKAMDMFLVAGNEGVDNAIATYSAVAENPSQVLETSQAYYEKYLDECVSVHTPDSVFNDGFKWATLSSAQFIVETPGIDKSLMAGYSSSRYSADWGVRMIDETNPIFNPRAYHYGSVWPLFTGWTALAEYQVGRYNQGFSHIMSNVLNYKGLSYGRMPEVLNGSTYQSSGVTLHQCWSETMVLQPIIEGMLGFVPDAVKGCITLAPRIPFDWDTLQASNLKVGDNSVSFDMKRDKGKITYCLSSDKPIKMNFIPAFAPGTIVNKVLVDGKETSYSVLGNREYVDLALETQLGEATTIEVMYSGGAAVLPQISPLIYGNTSNGVRVMSQQENEGVLETVIEGRAGTSSTIRLYLPDGYKKIDGIIDEISGNESDIRTFSVSFEKSEEPYVTKTIKVSL